MRLSRVISGASYFCRSSRLRILSATPEIQFPAGIATSGQGSLTVCHFGSSPVAQNTDGEKKITDILQQKLAPTYIQVRDISGLLIQQNQEKHQNSSLVPMQTLSYGGCGSMYEIVIDSDQFKGQRMLQQHRMINDALGEEIVKSLHGLTIRIGNPQTKS